MIKTRLLFPWINFSIIFLTAGCIEKSSEFPNNQCHNESKLVWDSSYSEISLNLDSLLESENIFSCLNQFPAYSTFELRTYHNQLFVDTMFPDGCFMIKSRNIIDLFVSEDSILWNNRSIASDSIQPLWLNNVRNNGKDPHLSDSPEKLLVVVSFTEGRQSRVQSIIDGLRSTHLSLLEWYSERKYLTEFCGLKQAEFRQVIESFPLNIRFALPESFYYRRTNRHLTPPVD